MMRNLLCIIISFLLTQTTSHAQLRAGAAKESITPETPMWLNGYAGRDTTATASIHPIWAKCLVIEENISSRVVFVTTDLLGLTHEIVEDVFTYAAAKYHIQRSQLIMNASHTHSGPVVWPCLDGIHDFNIDEQRYAEKYVGTVTQKIKAAIDNAFASLQEAKLYSGHSTADFAINRRNLRDHNNNGSTDHDVPVLKVVDKNEKPIAVLFGYACHNTTLVDDNYLFNGDYAGFAQIEIEKNNPGATALFLMGCGGDQNPQPRGTAALASKYGKELADAVQQTIFSKMTKLASTVRTGFVKTNLQFQPFDIAMYQKDIAGDNKYFHRRAKLMLEAYNKGWDVSKLPYPIQAVKFGNDFTIIALSGEVVSDYSLRTKKMLAGKNVYVAGYCNEVTCYIPSTRVLKEGGYEADESMVYYGMPGPFADDVEERIFKGIKEVLRKVTVK